jgi:hypothetical protein
LNVTAGTGTPAAQNTSDPFVIDGQTLSISGGSENDLLVVDFTTATNFNVNFNGYGGAFSTTGSSPITDIVFTGGSSENNIIDVTTVSGSNTAQVGPSSLSLTGPTYEITATNVQSIGLLGTATDTAFMTGNASYSNGVTASPTGTVLVNDAKGETGLDPVYNAVDGYGVVVVGSTNAGDTANLYGATSGDNTLYGSKAYSYMEGSGYNVQVVGFPTVSAWSRSSGDVASLYTAAGDHTSLIATAASAAMKGTNYDIMVNNFPAVYATSQGTDSANLSGSGTEENEFIASDPYTSISGNGYEVLTYNFNNISTQGSGSGGGDTAYFYGVSDHNAFTGAQARSEMVGTDASGATTYDYVALDFASVLASTLSASDTANLQGEAAGDQFIAGPIQNYPVAAALIGAADAFSIQVFAFQQITATSAGDGGDYAALVDPPGTNSFTGQGKNASLATPLSTYTAIGFANVAATSDDQGTDDENVGAVDYALTMNGNWANS